MATFSIKAATVRVAYGLGADAISSATFMASAINAAAISTDAAGKIADAVWDEDIVTTHGDPNTAGRNLRTLDAVSDRTNNSNLNALLGVPDAANVTLQTIRSGAAAGGTQSTITLDGSASAQNNFYKDAVVLITEGEGAGQARRVRDYVGSSKLANVVPDWVTAPNGTTSKYVILPATSVWDELRSYHTNTGSLGEGVASVQGNVTGSVASVTAPVALSAAYDVYLADLGFNRVLGPPAANEYVVAFTRNGELITANITDVKLTVTPTSGTALFTDKVMTAIGATGYFAVSTTTSAEQLPASESAIAKITFKVNSVPYTSESVISRDT